MYDIETKLEQLASTPELGRKRPEIASGYHSSPVGKHIIFIGSPMITSISSVSCMAKWTSTKICFKLDREKPTAQARVFRKYAALHRSWIPAMCLYIQGHQELYH